MSDVSSGTLAEVLVLIVVVFLLSGAGMQIFNSVRADTPKEQCRASMALRMSAQTAGGLIDPFKLVCPRKIVIMEDDKATERSLFLLSDTDYSGTYSYDSVQKTDEGVRVTQQRMPTRQGDFVDEWNQMLAYEMAECWDLFLEGKVDIIDSNVPLFSMNTCVICSEFSVQRTAPGNIESLQTHLRNTSPHRADMRADHNSYWDYLFATEPPAHSTICNNWMEEKRDYDMSISPEEGQTYAVFYYRKGSFIGNTVTNVVSGLRVWDDTEYENGCRAVGVAPVTEIAKYCQVLLN